MAVARTLPELIPPMMAKLSDLPRRDGDYAYEIKWDGIRALTFLERGRVRIQSRNLLDLTGQYPELLDLPKSLQRGQLVFDGEIVALDARGVPSFERLQPRMHLDARKAAILAPSVPVTYMIFDLLYHNGKSLLELPYTGRRSLLDSTLQPQRAWQLSAYHIGDGAQLLEATRLRGFEGLVAKRLDSSYEPGRRSGAWLKIKNNLRQEAVIGGWLYGEGSRSGKIGALLVGYYDVTPEEAARRRSPQKLVYAGKVGTGFTDKTLDELATLLAPLQRRSSPFDVDGPRYRSALYVEPRLVGECQFTEWTNAHMMRHPSFKGLREDKDARDVIREMKTNEARV